MRLSKYNEIIGRLKKIMINSMFRVPVENVTRKRGKIFGSTLISEEKKACRERQMTSI